MTNKFILFLSFFLLFPVFLQAQNKKLKAPKHVYILTDTSAFNFIRITEKDKDYEEQIFSRLTQIILLNKQEQEFYTKIVLEELQKYKDYFSFRKKKFKKSLFIHIFKQIYLFEKDGYVTDKDSLGRWISGCCGLRKYGVSEMFLATNCPIFRETIHHEISSFLLQENETDDFIKKWEAINENIKYDSEKEDSIRLYIPKETHTNYIQGFLDIYAYTTLENDFNRFAEVIFLDDVERWKIVYSYPKLELKLNLILEFYYQLSPIFEKELKPRAEKYKKLYKK